MIPARQSFAMISIVICTHNPKPASLQHVLDALRSQTLPFDQWELLLIDNASQTLLSERWDISWHPTGRHLREDELGLSYARRRGATEACGDVIVFVDDDNVLASDYLELVVAIMSDASIGALGGASTPIFDEGEAPPPHFYNFTPALACGAQLGSLENVCKDLVDLTAFHDASLFGAGLAVRRADFLDLLNLPHFPLLSGRQGTALSTGEDYEMCHLIALKGKRLVSSARLKFGHIIPSRRWDPAYLHRLAASNAAIGEVLRTYVAARRLYAASISARSLVKKALRVWVSGNSRLEAFEFALLFGNERFAWLEDRKAFKNICAASRQRQTSSAPACF